MTPDIRFSPEKRSNITPPLLIDWVLTGYCNYDCAYCIQNENPRCRKEPASPVRIEALINAIRTLDRKCAVSMSGGEPTTHPCFIEICSKLSQSGAYLEILSNLSGGIGRWQKIISGSGGRLLGVVGTFHPDYADIDEFTKIYTLLSSENITVEISVVAVNTRFEKIKNIINSLRANGIPAKPAKMIREHAFAEYSAEYSNWISGFHNNVELHDSRTLTGIKCPAGKDYIRIKPGGEIWTCASANKSYPAGPSGYLGNIKTDGFSRLFRETVTCPHKFCVCPVPIRLNDRIIESAID
jgi:MoaA/NifB/PqqE/SkfB family radical SAM enzyme